MGENIRLNQVIRELNISLERALEFLSSKGIELEARPTTKISGDVYEILLDGFKADRKNRKASEEISEEKRKEKGEIREALEKQKEQELKEEEAKHEVVKAKAEKLEIKPVGKIELEPQKPVAKKKNLIPFSVYYFDENGPYKMEYMEDGKFDRPFGKGFFNVADDLTVAQYRASLKKG